jgi:hypothetical protein
LVPFIRTPVASLFSCTNTSQNHNLSFFCCLLNASLDVFRSPISHLPTLRYINPTLELASTLTGPTCNRSRRTAFSRFSPISNMTARPKWHQGILFNNASHSDIIIRCGSQTIYAHKSILMAKSGLFYTAFNSELPIAQASTYDVDGHDPEIVENMIRYIYDSPYHRTSDSTSLPPHNFALQLFAIANEYQVERFGSAIAHYLVHICAEHVKQSKTAAEHLTALRSLLEQIRALYQDNVIADRALIDRVADFLRTESCRMLTTSVPEVLEILYVQRTSHLGYRAPPTSSSTLFPSVTMADYSSHSAEDNSEARGFRFWNCFRDRWIRSVKAPDCMSVLVTSETRTREIHGSDLILGLEDVWWEIRARRGERRHFLAPGRVSRSKLSKRC